LWDLHDGPGDQVITATADALSQNDELGTRNSSGRARASVRGLHVELFWPPVS
jgi:hypothetical protein